jgi:hypothetical protein
MTPVTVTTADTLVVAPGQCDYIHLYNNSGATIYLNYEGAAADVASGVPLLTGTSIQLNNDGAKQLFVRGVRAIVAAATAELRVQRG